MKLTSHASDKFVKLMYIGDSSTGKTGSMVSLVKAGYNLKILDLDNGLDILRNLVMKECPDNIDLVDYITIRDEIRPGQQGPIVTPKAFVEATKYLTTWDDGSVPSEFGPDGVVVLDTLTTLGKSAFEWAKGMSPGAKDPRQWYFAAQQAIENILGMLTSTSFHSNVLIIGHINYKELQDGSTKGYPTAVGSALGPIIPRYFNTLIMAESIGAGRAAVRQIRTVSSPMVDLKTPLPFSVSDAYPLGSGLASLFEKLKHEDKETTK